MDGYTKAKHQAAGHDGAMVDESGMVFIKPTTQQEIAFYTKIQSLPYDECREYDLDMFLPAFMGTLEYGITEQVEKTQTVNDELREMGDRQNSGKPEKPYAVMENLLFGYTHPSIMDIKLGSVLHDENTPDEKRERLQEVSHTTTSGSLNYRICGMKMYNNHLPDLSSFETTNDHVFKDEDGYIVFDKWYGRALRNDNVVDHFKMFFNHNNLNDSQRKVLLENMIMRLEILSQCLRDTELRIRSGSLLFTYDSNPKRWDELKNNDPLFPDQMGYEDDGEVPTVLSQLNLIDFAHARFSPGEGPDEDIIKGVENLITVLKQL
jgi:1D-myo-inositol-tetrakisphosphate 5-kinase/inositol-polyphosphate multikinase